MTEKQKLKAITFGEWLVFWYNTYKVPYLKPYSLRNIEQVIRLHTPEFLKKKKLQKVTIFDIDSALSEKPVNRTYIYTRQVWHSAFVKACRLGIIDKNPVSLCERVKYAKKRGEALTIEEQKEFMHQLEQSRYKWLMLFYMNTGTRRTEALTLEWQDINTADKLILIRGTKTADSYRYIPLSEELERILQGQKTQNGKEDYYGDKIFPYRAETVSRNFKKLCGQHHLHELRHTFITRCAESGMNINVCQQLVGHSTPALTLSVYTHVMDEFKRKEAAKFTLFPNWT